MPRGRCVFGEIYGDGRSQKGGVRRCPHQGEERGDLNSDGLCGACSKYTRRLSRDYKKANRSEGSTVARADIATQIRLLKILDLANSCTEVLTLDALKTIRAIVYRPIDDMRREPMPEEELSYKTQEQILFEEEPGKAYLAKLEAAAKSASARKLVSNDVESAEAHSDGAGDDVLVVDAVGQKVQKKSKKSEDEPR
jgi:hypothetical protein